MQAARGTPLTGRAASGLPEGSNKPSAAGPSAAAGPAEPAAAGPAEPAAAGPAEPAGPAAARAGGATAGAPAVARAAPRRVAALLGVAVAVLAVDITTKAIVVATLSNRPPIVALGGFLTLTEDRNPGAAFSIGGPSVTVVFSAIAVGVIIFVLRTSRRIRSLPWAVTLGLLLGGAMGNLTDRLFRYPGPLRGWVVDWIQWPHWPVFNIADSAIVCGGVLAVLLAFRGLGIDGTRAGDGTRGDGGTEAGGGTKAGDGT
jgi:lipoprotein signal peptidase